MKKSFVYFLAVAVMSLTLGLAAQDKKDDKKMDDKDKKTDSKDKKGKGKGKGAKGATGSKGATGAKEDKKKPM